MLFPSISQTETWPPLIFCIKISDFPSLLKSPVPIGCQLGPGLATGPPPIMVFASTSQSET